MGAGFREAKISRLLVLIFVAIGSACSDPTEPTGRDARPTGRASPSMDGRFATECVAWPVDDVVKGTPVERPLCHPPFVRVVARPEDFHGSYLMLSGILVIDGGGAVLFPDPYSVEVDDQSVALRLEGPMGELPNFASPRRVLGRHVVIGRLDASVQASEGINVGTLAITAPPNPLD